MAIGVDLMNIKNRQYVTHVFCEHSQEYAQMTWQRVIDHDCPQWRWCHFMPVVVLFAGKRFILACGSGTRAVAGSEYYHRLSPWSINMTMDSRSQELSSSLKTETSRQLPGKWKPDAPSRRHQNDILAMTHLKSRGDEMDGVESSSM